MSASRAVGVRGLIGICTKRVVGAAAVWVAAMFVTVVPALAQSAGTVAGTVTHAQTGEPVSSVLIRVVGGRQTAVTRADGSYRLQLTPGRHELQLAVLGFAAASQVVTVSAGQTTTQNFALTPSALPLNEIVAVGTRRADRTVTESPVPVDVIPAAAIQNTGLAETSQILQRLAPSVNFPRTAIADGSDHLRPVTLRGLAPDQVPGTGGVSPFGMNGRSVYVRLAYR